MWISGSYFDLTPCYDIYSGYVYVARYNFNSSFFMGGGRTDFPSYCYCWKVVKYVTAAHVSDVRLIEGCAIYESSCIIYDAYTRKKHTAYTGLNNVELANMNKVKSC